MDFRHPSRVTGPSLDGELLAVLANADSDFTGRELAQLVHRPSHRGVLLALGRLVEQGIVRQRKAGRAKLYTFNREHVAAPWIEGLAGLRQQLLERMREHIAQWHIPPVVAALFGSVARGEAGPSSDLDIFLVRPVEADEDAWEEQVAALTAAATRWTGNDARVLELSEDELAGASAREPVIDDVLDQGVEVGGSLRALRRLARA